jgi:hypothetical protein
VVEDEGEVRLQLRQAGGAIVLERELPLQPASASGEACRALAQAAALVVVRYLQEIGYRPATAALPPEEPAPAQPPAPPQDRPVEVIDRAPPALAVRADPAAPAPSAGFLGAAGGVRGGAVDGRAHLRTELSVGLAATRGWIAAELAAGVSSEDRVAVAPGADLRLRAYPLRAGLGVPLPLFGGTILPAAGVTLDLLQFRASGLSDAQRGLRLEPAAELGLGYRAAGRRLFVRGSLWGGFSLAPRDFDAGMAEPVFRTSAAYLRVQVETGLVLWKN